MDAIWILLGLLAVLAGAIVYYYNKLVQLANAYKNALRQIDVVLKQRHDMIPNLVETVRGYAAHERETFMEVVEARQGADEALKHLNETGETAGLGMSENMLTAALGKLFALSEAYPDLKASENFLKMQEDLRSIEERVGAARRGYNMTVLEYNNGIEMFPGNLIANMFNYRRASELEFDDAEQIAVAPQVSFT